MAKGRLTYAVALARERYLITAELDAAFELVVRDITGRDRPRELLRIRLGSVDYDISRLAVDERRLRVFVASRDGSVRGFDVTTGERLVTWRLGSPATAVAVSPGGDHVAMGTSDGVLCLRRYRDGALLQCVVPGDIASRHRTISDQTISDQTISDQTISDLAFSGDGTTLASCAWTGDVIVWQIPSLRIGMRRTFPGAASALAFSPDSSRLAIARSAFPPRRTPSLAARERRGGHHLPHPDHAVSVWALDSHEVVALSGHGGPVTGVAWTPDGERLLSSSWDRTVRMWDPGRGVEVARYGGFASLVRDLAVDSRGRFAAAGAFTRGRDRYATVVVNLLYEDSSVRILDETERSPD